MADDGGSSQEKTEEPTPKRLREARKKGQVAKSKDLNTVVILIAAVAAIWVTAGYMAEQLKLAMQESFTVAAKHNVSVQDMVYYASINFFQYIKASWPFMTIVTAAALAVGYLQVGSVFSAEPLTPQMKRLNMVENIKNMMKVTTLIELVKNIAKLALIFLLAYLVVKGSLNLVLETVNLDLASFMAITANIILKFLVRVLAFFVVIAVIDLFVQRHQHIKQLKMSKEEVKREYKQDEGDPHIKAQRKHLHQELAMSDVRQSVGASDVVITNPTHLAIAIKYDEDGMMAPQIAAKGQRLFAQMIREVAEEFHVPIVRNVPLAWSLIELEVGDEIPEDLYQAVAEILIVIYRMKGKTA
ncbi:MAG: flagellar biosynthesis protein FlhB [Deltaproteobacteria bacterium CG11_big_fil_rev_8_21_14_0_20_47_16]|nr:MAG: flagellar biosynthesis protein FlhB [Deltaproteobacteria bacterium CG11_big_fil_rev_8_21_14_0_20_47_16]